LRISQQYPTITPHKIVMKNRRFHLLLLIAALGGVVTVVSFATLTSRGQSRGPKSKSAAHNPVRTSSTNANFTEAAARNATLRNDLVWTFGGKQQRGWYLYDLLIGETLDTRNNPVTSDFAESLASWQKKMRLSPNGVLDENTLMAMVSQWQSKRLKNRTPAEPNQLLTAPPSDFYDSGRAAELRQVERNTHEAYKKMVAAAIADPALKLAHTAPGELAPRERYLKIISSFRSREYQDQLRQKSPNSGRAGLAVNSPHFTGRALDIYVGGDPVDTKDSNRAIQVNTRVYQWLVRNAERFGFRPYFYEPWHWEYVK
jgi:zinc D-Ala-D-Ala carboxypeptidase